MATGESKQRLDAIAKVTGRARYTDDLELPGMRHAVYVRSKSTHALIKNIDAAKALEMPGVEAVFTYKDVPGFLFATAGHAYSLNPAEADVADRLLLTNHSRCFGDEIAVVVARDDLTARKAASLVTVEYDELPVITSAEAAMADNAPQIHPGGNKIKSHVVTLGAPVDQAFAEQGTIEVGGDFTTPIVQHCHLELFTAYAYMEDNEHIVVVSSTQIPHICRRITAQALGIDWARVRVVKPYIGGGFGAKQDVVLEPMVAFLTMKMGGKPVKISLTREECFANSRTRHPFKIKGRMGVTPSGNINAIDLDVLSNTGAYASHGHSIAAAASSKIAPLYPRAAYSYKAATWYSNTPVAGAMRGYGAPQAAYALDCLVEDAARAVKMDPVEFRLKNVIRPGDYSHYMKKNIITAGIAECLEKGRDIFKWHERRAAAPRTGDIRRGVGVACTSYGACTYPVAVEISSTRMILNQDGTVTLSTGATEIGQGADTTFAQMAAKTLGLDFERFHVVSTQDTDHSPFDPGSFASRQSFVASNSIRKCAEDLKRKILAHAAFMTGHTAESLTICGRNVVFAHDESMVVLGMGELALNAYYDKNHGGQITAETSVKTRANPPCFAVTFVEVEIDIPLCRAKVVDILNVHDSGAIINPLMAAGQVHGGVFMGIGWSLYEELLVDAKSGKVLNNNLLDYKFPTFMDIPDIGHSFVETWEPTAGYGNKALGEPPVVSVAPAIRNAVLDATGIAINEIPMTPKVLFRYFSAAGII